VGRVLYTFAIHECFRTSCFTNYLQNVGMLLVFVYDLYFWKQFILSNRSLFLLYTSSWSYVTCLPFLVVNVITVLVPINDFLITNLLVVMLFVLVLFDMLVCFKLFIRLTYIVSVYSRVSVVCRLGPGILLKNSVGKIKYKNQKQKR